MQTFLVNWLSSLVEKLSQILGGITSLGLVDQNVQMEILRQVLIANSICFATWICWEPETKKTQESPTGTKTTSMRYIRRSQRLDEDLDIIEDDCPLPPVIDSHQLSYLAPKTKLSIRAQSFTDGWRLLVGASSSITTDSGASGSFGIDLALNEIAEEAVMRPTRQLLDLISNIEKALGASVLVVSPSHRLIGATTLGIETAERLAATSIKRGELLADPLLNILQTAASQKSQIPYQHSIETSGQSLTTWVVPLPSKNHRLLVIQPESKTSPREKALETLSKRELEVLKCLKEGKSNDEIATSLSISPNTVKNHLDRVFKKLGVTNRFAAALSSTRQS